MGGAERRRSLRVDVVRKIFIMGLVMGGVREGDFIVGA